MVEFEVWSLPRNNSLWLVTFASWRLTRYPQWEELLPMVERSVDQLMPLFSGRESWDDYRDILAHHIASVRKGVKPDPEMSLEAVAARFVVIGAEHFVGQGQRVLIAL